MAVYLPPTDALWTIQAKERARYEEQFKSLNPENGVVTGEQAKGFFLQSQLPPSILGQIWALSDTDSDGRMNINEFSIACKLINLKLRGFQTPASLPPALKNINVQFPTVGSPDTSKMKNSILPQVMHQLPTQPLPVQTALVNQPYVGVQPTGPLMNVEIPGVSPIPRTSISGSPQLTPAVGMPIKTPSAGIINNMSINQPLNFSVGNQNIPPSVIPPTLPQTSDSTNQIPCIIPQVQAITTSPISGIPNSATITANPSVPSSVPQDCTTECPKPIERGQSIDSLASALGSPVCDWAVPHQSKLKYTQLFNTTDRTRTGFLSGPQAKNILIQTKLPQAVLAQIWALADCDSDGRINCEEFVLAMHLCDMAKEGRPIPSTLPVELIPPAMRRKRNSSFSVSDDKQDTTLISNVTFEDKRKENFDKGQAELERRRAILLEAQRKEQEEREKKEREEQEKREALRAEQEARRQEELQKQLQKQREIELEQEEQRKRALEQREAARKELEKQRQLEWEKARTLELEAQRMKEQDNVLKLKGKNQALAIELATLTGKVKELSQKISETRAGVSAVKTTIDGMRTTRDKHMAEMTALKSKLKEQNQRLLLLTQEKARLDAKNKVGAVANAAASEQIMLAFTNKQIIIKRLNEKIADLQNEVKTKTEDVENNAKILKDLKTVLGNLVNDCETLYATYSGKRDSILQLKIGSGGSSGWGNSTWKTATDVSNWNSATTEDTGIRKYRAIYKFESRNVDELSFEPGDIITVRSNENAEPGWLSGELRGATGWFPEAYVEIFDSSSNLQNSGEILGDQEKLPLEGISELPEPAGDIVGENLQEKYISIYRYESAESGDLCFEQGETITVIKKDGDWWTGVIGDRTGLFPSNYVEKIVDTAPTLETEETPSMIDDDSVFVQSTTEETKSEFSKSPLPISTSVSGRETPADLEQNKPVTPDFSSITSAQTKITKKGEVATVIAPYQATSSEQLSLARGQLVCIRKKTTTGWWEGELQAKGKKKQIGWFPASYVKVMSSRRLSQTTPDIEAEQNFEKVVAMFPYKAQNEDELSFEQDDVIKVLVKEEPTWWRGELKGTTGLFPSNYVMPLDNQSSSKIKFEEKLRQEAIYELLESERSYTMDMVIVRKVFEKPLSKSGLITPDQLRRIFLNWRELIKGNQALLTLLDKRKSESTNGTIDCVGDILYENLPRMGAYIKFCSSQLSAGALLQELTDSSAAFRELCKHCQRDPRTQGLPLSTFLVKPMQRITKYPLLIGKILQHTPSNHPDKPHLEKALRRAEKLCAQVNEGVRENENVERLEWLQNHVTLDGLEEPLVFNSETNCLGPRKFLYHGILAKARTGRELVAFLFTDFLMLTQPLKPLNGQFVMEKSSSFDLKLYKKPLLLKDITVQKTNSSERTFCIASTNGEIAFACNTSGETSQWVKHIKTAIEKCKNSENMSVVSRIPRSDDGLSAGRLLVEVVEAYNIKANNCLCKVSLNNQVQFTPPSDSSYKWNTTMQFLIQDIEKDVLIVELLFKYNFKPDDLLDQQEIRISEISHQTRNRGPVLRKLPLQGLAPAEILLKLDLVLFNLK